MAKKFRWIANDNVIDISDFYDKLPDAIKDMIKTAEKQMKKTIWEHL